jgi:hypothetical protein
MTVLRLGDEWAAAAVPAAVYLLGIGGPEDESGIGHVESFVWRYHLLEPAGEPARVLGFRDMRRLMAFTRSVNGERPLTVPTEVLRLELDELRRLPVPALWLDPEPAAYLAAAATGRVWREALEAQS